MSLYFTYNIYRFVKHAFHDVVKKYAHFSFIFEIYILITFYNIS